MATATLNFTQTFVTESCCHTGCGIVFAMEQSFVKARREDHLFWFCPNGHRQHYTAQTEAQKLQTKLEQSEKRAEYSRNEARRASERAEREKRKAAAARGQLTKAKNRAARGVCPQAGCQRSFDKLADHVKTEHPELLDIVDV
jgi:hypothetical protein